MGPWQGPGWGQILVSQILVLVTAGLPTAQTLFPSGVWEVGAEQWGVNSVG